MSPPPPPPSAPAPPAVAKASTAARALGGVVGGRRRPRRTRGHEEPENHERWLVSYADFITLLFAFFVVMYSMSSVNEGKFRVLADSLIATFKEPARSLDPIQVGDIVRSEDADDATGGAIPVPIPFGESGPRRGEGEDETGPGEAEQPAEATDPPGEPSGQDDGAEMADLERMAGQVEERLAPYIDEDLVNVRRMDSWLEVEFNTSILFESGAARLSVNAVDLLGDVAGMLREFPNPVQVEGFTDDVPIRTPQYPSNWELSAARAASVVHLFTKAGIRPERMVAIGYGEFRPIAANATEDGRRRNRRVVLVIPAAEDARRVLDLDRLSAASAGSAGQPSGAER